MDSMGIGVSDSITEYLQHMKIGKIAAMLLAGSGMLFSSCNEKTDTEVPVTSTDWGKEIRAELTGVGGDVTLYAGWQKKEKISGGVRQEELPSGVIESGSTFTNWNFKIVLGEDSHIITIPSGTTIDAERGGINFSFVVDDADYAYIDHIEISSGEQVRTSPIKDNPHWTFQQKYAIWENPGGADLAPSDGQGIWL